MRLQDCVMHTIRKKYSLSDRSSARSSSSSTLYPITYFVNYELFSSKHINFIAALQAENGPKTFKQAMQHEG